MTDCAAKDTDVELAAASRDAYSVLCGYGRTINECGERLVNLALTFAVEMRQLVSRAQQLDSGAELFIQQRFAILFVSRAYPNEVTFHSHILHAKIHICIYL